MSYLKKLENLIKQKNGTLLTSDPKDLDIPRSYLSKLVIFWNPSCKVSI